MLTVENVKGKRNTPLYNNMPLKSFYTYFCFICIYTIGNIQKQCLRRCFCISLYTRKKFPISVIFLQESFMAA